MIDITQAQPDDWQAAFALAHQHLPPPARELQVAHSLRLLAEGTLDPAGIWMARQDARVCGVHIVVPLGGGSFLFWLPETSGPRGNAAALIDAALAWSAQRGGKLAQAIVAPADAPHAAPLVRRGFRRVTQLLYLERDLGSLSCPTSDRLRYEPFTASTESCFRDALLRSYQGTRDCPELNGVRSVDEILEGYRIARAGGTAPWWLVSDGDEPVAVAILTDLPDGPAWDLSYLGVLPEYRRQGIGQQVTLQALRTAQAAGAAQMLLAVDARNTPARRLYESLGFIEMEARDVYLKFLAADRLAGADGR